MLLGEALEDVGELLGVELNVVGELLGVELEDVDELPAVELEDLDELLVIALDETDEAPDFGRYWIPEEPQLEVLPMAAAGTKVPVWTEPWTLK